MLNKSEYNNTVICVVPMEEMRRTSIRCNNGVICIKGARDKCVEVAEWLEKFGIKAFSRKHKDYNIMIDECGKFCILDNDERVWRDFDDFDVEVTFNLA